MLRRRAGHGPEAIGTRVVSLSDIERGDNPFTTRIDRPDQYSAKDHTVGIQPADGLKMHQAVTDLVHTAHAQSALDEYTPDFLDAWLDEHLAGWKSWADREYHERTRLTYRLMAEDVHNLAEVTSKLTTLRENVHELRTTSAKWRRELLGLQPVAPADHAEPPSTAPRPLDLPLGSVLVPNADRSTDELLFEWPTKTLINNKPFQQEDQR